MSDLPFQDCRCFARRPPGRWGLMAEGQAVCLRKSYEEECYEYQI